MAQTSATNPNQLSSSRSSAECDSRITMISVRAFTGFRFEAYSPSLMLAFPAVVLELTRPDCAPCSWSEVSRYSTVTAASSGRMGPSSSLGGQTRRIMQFEASSVLLPYHETSIYPGMPRWVGPTHLVSLAKVASDHLGDTRL